MGRRLAALLFAVALGATPSRAAAQRLSIQGDRFAVDGAPRFLTFVTYFGASGALDVDADLAFLRTAGFDGVRIWPNSPDGPRLMRSDGTLDAAALARVTFVLERARTHGLVVDVTFTAEHIQGLDAAHLATAIVATARALAAFDNVLFDIQNERNAHGPAGRPLAPADVAAIAASIKAAQPWRIVTASNAPGMTPDEAARFTSDARLDVTAYHDARTADWHTRERIEATVRAMRANGRPAYLQEPTRYPFPSADRAEYFVAARANAERAGAAAWCFHTELGFDLSHARFADRLRSRPQPEWAFVSALARGQASRSTTSGSSDAARRAGR
ncbi:MAG TPA: hypothetical protein VFB07_07055 [Vicinamibacterales bacterium]|nr:hypothetical protein [Vicinamibacterales bacterium]